MPDDMTMTFIILGIVTAMFLTGKFRIDLVALGSLLALLLFGIIDAEEALAGFANPVVVMIAGLFVVGAGILRTGLAQMIGTRILKLSGGSEVKLLILMMGLVGMFSGFISNTGTVAVLLPVIMTLSGEIGLNPSKLLIPLAYASSLGGVWTLIGTPPNLVISDTLRESGYDPLTFFSLAPVGLVGLAVGIIYILLFRKWLFGSESSAAGTEMSERTPQTLAGLYNLTERLHELEVPANSPLADRAISEINAGKEYGLTILEVNRKGKMLKSLVRNDEPEVGRAELRIQEGDQLLLFGSHQNAERFAADFDLSELPETEELLVDELISSDVGISEMLIAPQSFFVGRTISELEFRDRYNLNILSVKRGEKYIHSGVDAAKLQNGDALLVQGSWKSIGLLAKTSADLVVVGRPDEQAGKEPITSKAPVAGAIMLLMLILMTFGIVETVTAVLIAAMLMAASGSLRTTKEAYNSINWETVILLGGMLPMATALEKTGGVKFISDGMLDLLGSFGAYAVMAGFYFVTMLLSQFISNTATAVIFAPIAVTAAEQMGVSPYPLLIAVAVSASMAFSTPMASPPNALVMTAGSYKFSDFARAGVPLQIILAFIMLILIPVVYPF
ncbi:SLC13 family permease [Bacillus marinisedimentorum]|uniref:SLC13 family permease n=1 Tax=Bacillus marinisedimentorum TaxID=1821260 RepID=UPI000871C96A|nr:SLC13 family permease [Bacillus marinisedimentorum]